MIKKLAVVVLLTPLFAAGCGDDLDPGVRNQHRYVLESTVDYVHRWSRTNLSTRLGGPQVAGDIPAGAWDGALAEAIDGAGKVHIGCE